MRWSFYDPDSVEEAAEHERCLEAIDDWWKAFAAKTEALVSLFCKRSGWDLPRWMRQHLNAIDSRLKWEFGPAASCEGHRLVITPEADRGLRPLAKTLIEHAPAIPGWAFYAYRLPDGLEIAHQMVGARTGGHLNGVTVSASIGLGNCVDLKFHYPPARQCTEDEAR